MGSEDVYGYGIKYPITINSGVCILASVLLLRKILFLWENNMCLFFFLLYLLCLQSFVDVTK